MRVKPSTVDRWLRSGIPERSWQRVVRELHPTRGTLRRWERDGIPERTLRRLQLAPAPFEFEVPPQVRRYFQEEPDEPEETATEEYELGGVYDIDFWEQIAEEYEDIEQPYPLFEKDSP